MSYSIKTISEIFAMQSEAYGTNATEETKAINETETRNHGNAARAERLRLLSLAEESSLEAFLDGLDKKGVLPCWTLTRGPECGLVMVRGRIGGQGQAFNVGEALVTRCCVNLTSGKDHIAGCGYVLGESPRHAEMMAVCDALWQDEGLAPLLENDLLPHLAKNLSARYERDRTRSAATKVDFFTMVRGENKD